MQIFDFSVNSKKTILALGAESAGNFSVYKNNKIYFSENFEDLLDENNFNNFKKSVLNFLKKEKIKPNIILSDLHPVMKTTLWGEELSRKLKVKHIPVQHHHAHLFSAIGDSLLPFPLVLKGEAGRGLLKTTNYKLPSTIYGTRPVIAKQFYGVALDGTGYGTDEKIWGGEVFKISQPLPLSKGEIKRGFEIKRIGHLENHIMLGGELAIREPARILLSILNKFLDKKAIYPYVATFYSPNEFELLYNQLEQNFNCIETSSTGRTLDAVSLLLGFCNNERRYKHAPIDLLEKNSTKPYRCPLPLLEGEMSGGQRGCYKLNTTTLFKYLIKNLHKDKHRLAATAQLYLAQGLYEIIKKNYKLQTKDYELPTIFASGGITNNKIISKYFESKNIYLSKNIPRGDAGLSFGQIIYFLFNK